VGKGTQADLINKRFGTCQLSTGEVFRAAKKIPASQQTLAIREAVQAMNSGGLVKDSTVIALVKERVACLRCKQGFMLDGFPRTVAQAEALEGILASEQVELDYVLSYELPVEQVVERLAGRRVCPSCKRSYHIKDVPPSKPGICDDCGTALVQREDDKPEAIRTRLAVYEKSTAPLIEYYSKKGKILHIRCGDAPQETFKRTLKALGCS
jgi:adenylate kinase